MLSLIPIPRDDLPRMVGKPVHLVWANPACVWILIGVDGERLELMTPKTGKRLVGRAADARYARQHEPKKGPTP